MFIFPQDFVRHKSRLEKAKEDNIRAIYATTQHTPRVTPAKVIKHPKLWLQPSFHHYCTSLNRHPTLDEF